MVTFRRVKRHRWMLGLGLVSVLFSSACSMRMQHDALAPAPVQFDNEVRTSRRAEGIDGKVGWSRFTLLAIPLVPVNLEMGFNFDLASALTFTARKNVRHRGNLCIETHS